MQYIHKLLQIVVKICVCEYITQIGYRGSGLSFAINILFLEKRIKQ